MYHQLQEADKKASSSDKCQYKADPSCPFDVEIIVFPNGAKTKYYYRFLAHKEILSEISDVFSAMLGGSFAESRSGRVVLRNVRPRAFLAILHHLYGCSWNCTQVEQQLDIFVTSICIEEYQTVHKDPLSNDILSGTVDSSANDLLNSDHLLSLIFTTKAEEAKQNKIRFIEAQQCLELLACANQFLLMDLCTVCEEKFYSCLPLDSNGIHLPSLFVYCHIHEAKILPQSILDYILLQLGNPSLCLKLFREILAGPTGYAALMLVKNNICNFLKR